eukprot:CAMPEP_0203908848 /NCGR_PEP_ID=MMETSP0359-20131031/50206_1 /ASSEMBLY_ACC=CAM_ASM_000338 /TAXON_ID=268821 /ORGANISM="Scrippsiella Hangoei, Strain SHTV-5" /LENGTH=52 /DNA_ID=CAMNT_0050833937 /DNA_START=187 /DNA_END=342 /DNA_ORIENTATION=-
MCESPSHMSNDTTKPERNFSERAIACAICIVVLPKNVPTSRTWPFESRWESQ